MRLKALEDENAKLKQLLADAMLDNAALKELGRKTDHARGTAGAGAAADLRAPQLLGGRAARRAVAPRLRRDGQV